MELIRSYVVRIYRKDCNSMAGVVEDVRTGNARPFRSSEELWSALSCRRRQSSGTDPDSNGVKLRVPK